MPDPAHAVLRHRLWDAHTQLELDLCVDTRSIGADEVEEAEEELWEERALSASLAAQVMKLKSKINHRGTESTEENQEGEINSSFNLRALCVLCGQLSSSAFCSTWNIRPTLAKNGQRISVAAEPISPVSFTLNSGMGSWPVALR